MFKCSEEVKSVRIFCCMLNMLYVVCIFARFTRYSYACLCIYVESVICCIYMFDFLGVWLICSSILVDYHVHVCSKLWYFVYNLYYFIHCPGLISLCFMLLYLCRYHVRCLMEFIFMYLFDMYSFCLCVSL